MTDFIFWLIYMAKFPESYMLRGYQVTISRRALLAFIAFIRKHYIPEGVKNIDLKSAILQKLLCIDGFYNIHLQFF